jgi:hypothetical protein
MTEIYNVATVIHGVLLVGLSCYCNHLSTCLREQRENLEALITDSYFYLTPRRSAPVKEAVRLLLERAGLNLERTPEQVKLVSKGGPERDA